MPARRRKTPAPVLPEQAEHIGEEVEADREVRSADRLQQRVRCTVNLHNYAKAMQAPEFSAMRKIKAAAEWGRFNRYRWTHGNRT